ncbi:hypothetical protein FRB98_004439 [Tulasnella sp. 332]|nr:hypothetical protein FRB98_004439 [Tulasnella sp. 332]
MGWMQEEVKTAANSIDKYSKTRFLVKVIKANQWEEKLIAHTEAFGERKKDLKFALQIHLSVKYEERDASDKSSGGLRRELSANVDDVLKANEALFLKKFDAQTTQLTEALDRSADKVIRALGGGPYERVEDPDIRALWKEEGWRSNVKARVFILSLHDYFTTYKPPTGADPEQDPRNYVSQTTFIGPGHPDMWTLHYMRPLFIIPIQDAIDEDGSGFVSIHEINEFTRPKPKDMSLPVWIAYWAQGWLVESDIYEKKIRSLIKQMREMQNTVLDDNKDVVDNYLSNQLDYVEKLTTWGVDEKDKLLLNMVEAQRAKDEARITRNLEDIKYEIDSSAAILAVCGPGRVERYLLPLLYALLKRHAQIIKLCKEYILDGRELELATASLAVVIEEVSNRVYDLKAGFTQQRLDLKNRFAYFCNSLYQDLFQMWYGDDESNGDSESDEESSSFGKDSNGTGAGLEAANGDAPVNTQTSEDSIAKTYDTSAATGVGIDDGDNKAVKPEEGDCEREESRPGTPTTVVEEVVPLTVDLLRYPATKAEKEVIEAHLAKLAAENTVEGPGAVEAEGSDARDGGDGPEDEAPPKSVEDRLESLEDRMESLEGHMKRLLESVKEIMHRLPKRR